MPKVSAIVKNQVDMEDACQDILAVHRRFVEAEKSRIMVSNRLQSLVVIEDLGYNSNRTSKEDRKKLYEEAAELIERVVKGEATSKLQELIKTTWPCIQQFQAIEAAHILTMDRLVASLPIDNWLSHKDQRGIARKSIARIIGCTGNLANYSHPGKVFKRMGLKPYTYKGVTAMGQAWSKMGDWTDGVVLNSTEWQRFGYVKTRRKVAHIIGANIVKSNYSKKTGFMGPYRQKYDDAKASAKVAHPDWADIHTHKHAMLIASKLFVKNLWIAWNSDKSAQCACGQRFIMNGETERCPACVHR